MAIIGTTILVPYLKVEVIATHLKIVHAFQRSSNELQKLNGMTM